MPSSLNAYVLPAVMLAALLLGVTGGPIGDAPIDNPSGDPSGEEMEAGETSDLLSNSPLWDLFIGVTARHKKQFEDEFQNSMNYSILKDYKIPSVEGRCPGLNKESCLHRLVQGLLKFQVLLKHVEKEYPRNSILPEAQSYSSNLISLIKDKMKHRDRVRALTSSQEEQLLKELENPFHRKMAAHSVLYHLYLFLVDGKRAVTKKEGNYQLL